MVQGYLRAQRDNAGVTASIAASIAACVTTGIAACVTTGIAACITACITTSVTTDIAGAKTISIITEKNQQPLTASFDLGPGAEGYVSTRIKMGKTSNVIAVVKADGKLHSASKEVKVTIGGCGG